ncbi:uncharacterized protein [Saccopteryx leptura]|uniref:uncharacterized protein n=1 Tax=Saccopteryx leptura TaxID=249018 RepID=UPI00339C7D51
MAKQEAPRATSADLKLQRGDGDRRSHDPGASLLILLPYSLVARFRRPRLWPTRLRDPAGMRAELGSLAVSNRVFLHRPHRCAARHWPPRVAPARPPRARVSASLGPRNSRTPPRPRLARLLPLRFFPFSALPQLLLFLASSKPRPKQANKSIQAGRSLTAELSVPVKAAPGTWPEEARGHNEVINSLKSEVCVSSSLLAPQCPESYPEPAGHSICMFF